MADLVEFFLKQANRDDLPDAGPPYLVNFKMARPNIEAARIKASDILIELRRTTRFEDDSHAAQHAIADAVITNGHMDRQVQQTMAFLLVHLATNSAAKIEAIDSGADLIGYVLTPNADMVVGLSGPVGTSSTELAQTALLQGLAPFTFKYVTAKAE